ncbi:hypothetical protein D3C83_283820 [compost metagenome]
MAAINEGGAVIKKLPIIGLIIGGIAAFLAARKKKQSAAEEPAPTEDTGSV